MSRRAFPVFKNDPDQVEVKVREFNIIELEDVDAEPGKLRATALQGYMDPQPIKDRAQACSELFRQGIFFHPLYPRYSEGGSDISLSTQMKHVTTECCVSEIQYILKPQISRCSGLNSTERMESPIFHIPPPQDKMLN